MSRSPDITPTLPPKKQRGEDKSAEKSGEKSGDKNGLRAVQESFATRHICPFCGSQNPAPASGAPASPCPKCTMEDTAATRQATKARIGPWHVLQTRNPAAPGMRYATVLALIGKGQVTARSIVRGPTTHQLWRWAGHVRGLSREFGMCYSCGQAIDRAIVQCPNCDRSQEPQGNPDALLEIRENARDPRVAAAGALAIVGDDSAGNGGDPYAVRSLPAAGAGSHADRLRNNGDYRPVDTRIDTRADLPGMPRRRDGRILSSMELAAALQVAPAEPPAASSRPVRTALLTILVVGGLAAVVIGYTRPDLRRQTTDWAESTWQPIQRKLSGFTLQSPPPAVPSSGADASSNDVAGGTSPSDPSPAMTQTLATSPPPNSQAIPQAIPQANSQTVPQSALQSQSVAPNDISPPSNAPPANATPPNVSTPTVPANPANPVPDAPLDNLATTDAQDHPALQREKARLSPGVGVNQSSGSTLGSKDLWALRSRAMDAESHADWGSAIKLYQQIETAPKELWPVDTKVRLANARRAFLAQ